MKTKIKKSIPDFIARLIILVVLFCLLRIIETIIVGVQHSWNNITIQAVSFGLLKDIIFVISLGSLLYLPYTLIYLYRPSIANIFFIIFSSLACMMQAALAQYFLTALVPLGGDLWGYSWLEIQQTVGAAGGIKISTLIIFIVFLTITITAFIFLPKKLILSFYTSIIILFITIGFSLTSFSTSIENWKVKTEFANNYSISKSWFFYQQSWLHFFPEQVDIDIYDDSYIGDYGDNNTSSVAFNYIAESQYPFLHTEQTPDVLSPFFQTTNTKPNIVIILVEGLGRAFTNKDAYLGNFTPFVDSLSQHSLYWTNFLSTGGRTFAVLPSVLGSLPFGKNGFCEWGANMPKHISLISLLRYNGYKTAFYYGGNAHFDNMDIFLNNSHIDHIYDEKTFSTNYNKLPTEAGFSWGYGDKELFEKYFETINNRDTQNYCHVILTVATHNPFLINDQEKYLQKLESHLTQLGFNEEKKKGYRNYKYQYASILYADDALRMFFDSYSKRTDYNNTIFIITGDHRMPEIPMSTKLDRYHVPLIIFSPLLQRTSTFASISTHFDIAPSILAWLKKQYNINMPSLTSWMGTGLDTSRSFRNTHAYPFMQTKNDIIDFVLDKYMINSNNLFEIENTMNLLNTEDENKSNQLKGLFDKFKQRNQKLIETSKLIPDSIYQKYNP